VNVSQHTTTPGGIVTTAATSRKRPVAATGALFHQPGSGDNGWSGDAHRKSAPRSLVREASGRAFAPQCTNDIFSRIAPGCRGVLVLLTLGPLSVQTSLDTFGTHSQQPRREYLTSPKGCIRAEAKHVDTPIMPGDRDGSGFGRLRNSIAKVARPTNHATRAGPHMRVRRTMRRRKLSCRYLLVPSAGHAQLQLRRGLFRGELSWESLLGHPAGLQLRRGLPGRQLSRR
jgi:hypothetical protein